MAADGEFRAKTLFTRILMLTKLLKNLNKPKRILLKFFNLLSEHLMPIAVTISLSIFVAIIILKIIDPQNELPLSYFKEQKIEIRGRLECCTVKRCFNISNHGIELYDDNIFRQDSLLDETISKKDGRFNLYATSRQLGKIKPYLVIQHRCNMGSVLKAEFQSFRISWYRVPHYFVVDVSDSYYYLLNPLSLNVEGFVEIMGQYCPYVDCLVNLTKEEKIKKKNQIKKYMYYSTYTEEDPADDL